MIQLYKLNKPAPHLTGVATAPRSDNINQLVILFMITMYLIDCVCASKMCQKNLQKFSPTSKILLR
jgi:hypothetical protein